MVKTLLSMALWGALGWLFSLWIDTRLGWSIFSLGLIAMILVSGVQLSRISKWVKNIDSPPPPSVGPWDDILATIYRKLRKDRQDIKSLERNASSIMLAVEALPDGVITLNEAMEVTWCNPMACEHIGLTPEADYGHSIFNILRAPEFARHAKQASWPSPALLNLNKDGRGKFLLAQLTPYGTNQFLVVTRDVTKIEALERTRKDFVANVSHELRTPLTILSGFLETLRDMPAGSLSEDQRTHYQTLMIEQAKRMQAIVADLLTLSALEVSPAAQGRRVRLGAIIRSALQQARMLSRNQHTFIENIDDALCIDGIETELASAVSNLLTNAANYTPAGGTITVSWHADESGRAFFSVQDTGIGIASHDIPRLTERFYRVDRGRSRATGGTGLGLAIVKHVAMRHNAEISIRSRLGAGSLFSLEFPSSRVSVDEQQPVSSPAN